MITDPDRHIRLSNPALNAVFGYEADEVQGQPASILYESEAAFIRQGRFRFHPTAIEQLVPHETRYRHKNGEVFTAETVGSPIRDREGNTLGYLALIRDIIERLQTRMALQTSQAFLQSTFDALSAPVAVLDETDTVTTGSGEPGALGRASRPCSQAAVMRRVKFIDGVEKDEVNKGRKVA